VKDPDLSSADATLRLLDRPKRLRRDEATCIFAATASTLGVALVLGQHHPVLAAFAALALSALATALLHRAQMRREDMHTSMIERWERAETRRDAALVLRDLLRELGRTDATSPALGADDPLLRAVDEELAAELARRAAADRLRAEEFSREADAQAERRRVELLERATAAAAESARARQKFIEREFSDEAKQAAARVDEALLALEAKALPRAAEDPDAKSFLDASCALRAMLMLTPKSVVYEGRAPASTIGDDPARLRQVVTEAQQGAVAGRVFESATAAASLKEITRWSPFAQAGITPDVLALFDPVIAGAAPVDPGELAPPPHEPPTG
jgi:energy-converting hydrogenase Eha subunit E